MQTVERLEVPFASAPPRQAPAAARLFASKLATLAMLVLLLLGSLTAVAMCNAPASSSSVVPSDVPTPVPGPLD
jgi:hypothetical protein